MRRYYSDETFVNIRDMANVTSIDVRQTDVNKVVLISVENSKSLSPIGCFTLSSDLTMHDSLLNKHQRRLWE